MPQINRAQRKLHTQVRGITSVRIYEKLLHIIRFWQFPVIFQKAVLMHFILFNLTVFKVEEIQEADQTTSSVAGGVEGEEAHPQPETEAGTGVQEETEPDSGLGDSSVEGGMSHWKKLTLALCGAMMSLLHLFLPQA